MVIGQSAPFKFCIHLFTRCTKKMLVRGVEGQSLQVVGKVYNLKFKCLPNH